MRSAFRSLVLAATAAVALAAAAPRGAAAQEQAADEAVIAEMTAAAQALIEAAAGPNPIAATMGFNPTERLHHPIDSAARDDWSYWPRAREGLTMGQMTAQQRVLAHQLLESLLSAQGYLEVQAIWSLEDVLQARETASFARGVEHYAFAVFGLPGGEEPWGWRVDGHHVSLNVAIAGGELSVTPSFLGANPARVDAGLLAGLEPLRFETRAAFALLGSLDETQRAAALIGAEAPRDILSGQLNRPRETWDDWKAATAPAGLAATAMTDEQRLLLRDLVELVLDRYRFEIAQAQRDRIVFDALTFAWMGSREEGAPYYFRISSPAFVYEFDASGPDGNHVHSVWRDPENDFGEDALARHYGEGAH
jgi:hypothetical protein